MDDAGASSCVLPGDIFSSQNPQMHLYWFSGSFCSPKVAGVMPLKSFEQLKWFLHLIDRSKEPGPCEKGYDVAGELGGLEVPNKLRVWCYDQPLLTGYQIATARLSWRR